VSNQIGTCKNI